MLAYVGAEVEEKRYNFIGPQWDRSEWLNEKFTLGLDFPNVKQRALFLGPSIDTLDCSFLITRTTR